METFLMVLLAIALLLMIGGLILDVISRIILHKLEVEFFKDKNKKKEGK